MNSRLAINKNDSLVPSTLGNQMLDGTKGINSAVVRFVDVSKRYKDSSSLAVDNVSFEVYPGEFFSILGPSGSGKTSCLRMIAGFEQPTSGQITLENANLVGVPPHLRNVNTVFQNYALFPHMSIEENVSYPLRMARLKKTEIKQRTTEALALVEMHDYAKRLPHQLSGGQKQRVALARALVGKPKVLLLDEPLGALDLQLRQQMQTKLKDLQREVGITFIYVTHDQGEALSMSNRLAVMSSGRIEQIGTPKDVYFRPKTHFVAGFIGRANIEPGTVENRQGNVVGRWGEFVFPVAKETPLGPCVFSLRHESINLGSGAEDISAVGVIKDVVFLGDSLEVFVSVNGLTLVAKTQMQTGIDLTIGQDVTVSFKSVDVVRVDG